MVARELAQLRIALFWHPLITLRKSRYAFPQSRTVLREEDWSKPFVYRWSVVNSAGVLAACYIGETDNLFRRIGNYLNAHASQAQCFRISQRFREELAKGSVVELQTVFFETFAINDQFIELSGLSDPAKRKLVENMAIILHDRVHCELLNEDTSRIGRKIKVARTLVGAAEAAPFQTVKS